MLSIHEKYIDPRTDFGFQRVFAGESNKDILAAFLKTILPNQAHMVDLTYAEDGELRRVQLSLRYVHVELPKFNKQLIEPITPIDKWQYILRHLSTLSERPAILHEPVFKKLFEVALLANLDLEEQTAYENSIKHYRDIRNSIETSRQEGIKQARFLLKQQAARKMLRSGLSPEQIARITELPIKDIRTL